MMMKRERAHLRNRVYVVVNIMDITYEFNERLRLIERHATNARSRQNAEKKESR